MREHSKKISEDHAELFATAHLMQGHAQSILKEFNKRELKLFTLPANQRIFLFIITRSLKTYASVLSLCEKGYAQDAASLLRSLLENLITVKYMLHDRSRADELARRFVAYKWVIFRRYLPEDEKQAASLSAEKQKEFLKKKKLILERVEEFKKNFSVTSDRALVTWSGKTVRDMAKHVSRKWLEEYETTFRLCSRFSHPSILGDQEYMIQDDKYLTFSPLPSDIGVVANLGNAVKYAVGFLKILNAEFDFQFDEKLVVLESEIERVLRLPKYQNTKIPAAQSEQPAAPIRECIIRFKTETA